MPTLMDEANLFYAVALDAFVQHCKVNAEWGGFDDNVVDASTLVRRLEKYQEVSGWDMSHYIDLAKQEIDAILYPFGRDDD